MREILLVARREFVERGRDRTFLITNLVLLLLLVGGAAAPLLFGDEEEPFRIAAVGPEAQAVLAVAEQQQDAYGVDLDVRQVADRPAAEAAVRDQDLDAALPGPATVLVREDLPQSVESLVTAAAQGVALRDALAAAGVPPDTLATVTAPPELDVQALAGDDGGVGVAALVAFAAALLLYGLLLLLGQFIAQGIVEEKSSRVVEVLVSSIRPVQLLGGKVLGLGALGFLQLIVLAGVGVAAAVVLGGIDLPPGTLTAVALSLAWFVLGYAQYASLFATVGAVASRVEELQGSLLLAYVPVIAAFFAAQTALTDPGGPVARVTALLPFTAPMVQPIRAGAGVAPAWEPPLAIAVSLVTAIALVPVAARFYSGGVLHVRRKVGFATAWRAGR